VDFSYLEPYVSWESLRWVAYGLLGLGLLRWTHRRIVRSRIVAAAYDRFVGPRVNAFRNQVEVKRAERAGDWAKAAFLHEQAGRFSDAIDCYEKADEYHLCGELCLKMGRKDYAAPWFVLAGEKLRAAGLYGDLGHHLKAAHTYLEAGQGYDAAQHFVKAGELAKAGELYEQLANYIRAGEAFEKSGDYRRAGANLERHLLESTGSAGYRSGAGRADQVRTAERAAALLERSGETERAATILTAYEQYAGAAVLREKLEHYRDAAELYQKAGLIPKASAMYRRSGDELTAAALEGDHHLRSGNAHEAAESFLRAGDQVRAAEVFESVQRYDRAADCYEAVGAYAQAADSAVRTGNRTRAAELLEKAKQWDRAAELYAETGVYDRSARLYAEAGRFYEAAQSAQKAEREKAVLEYLQRVPPEDDNYPQAVVELARIFLKRGWGSLAISRLNRVVTGQVVSLSSLELWDVLAEAHAAEGDFKKAAEILHGMMSVEYGYGNARERYEELLKRISKERARATAIQTSSVARTPATPVTGVPVNGHRYEVQGLLGKGGMGAVYKAYDLLLRRPVAYKVLAESLATDAQAREQFLEEARAAAALNHPNVVTVFDLGFDSQGRAFISMELIEGENYAVIRKRKPRLDVPEITNLLISVCQGLEHAHQRGIVHRDLKPSNLLLTTDGRVKIADFGLARPIGNAASHDGSPASGTPRYMSPEQIRRDATDGRSDLYSLGALTYELLIGRPPFPSDNQIQHHLYTPAPPLLPERPDLPGALEVLVLRCLQKHPAERFQTAGELVQFALDSGLV